VSFKNIKPTLNVGAIYYAGAHMVNLDQNGLWMENTLFGSSPIGDLALEFAAASASVIRGLASRSAPNVFFETEHSHVEPGADCDT
jgi:hypothetical protein